MPPESRPFNCQQLFPIIARTELLSRIKLHSIVKYGWYFHKLTKDDTLIRKYNGANYVHIADNKENKVQQHMKKLCTKTLQENC